MMQPQNARPQDSCEREEAEYQRDSGALLAQKGYVDASDHSVSAPPPPNQTRL